MKVGSIERLMILGTKIRARLFTLLISSQFRQIGSRSRITPPFRFSGLHGIALGDGVLIQRDCWIQTVPSANDEESPKLLIGAHSAVGMGASISAAHKIVIGEYVLMARNVYISDHAHAFDDIHTPIVNQGINRISPVSIGRHTWLGQNVVVLPGVTIGEHCVIGANSVVNSSVPDYSVAVGAPVRVIRRLRSTGGTDS